MGSGGWSCEILRFSVSLCLCGHVLMKGLLLIGGLATRLLPLSKHVAKSLLPICDRELLHYQVTALARAGIGEVVLACGHKVEQVREYAAQYRGMTFHISEEPEPRGT